MLCWYKSTFFTGTEVQILTDAGAHDIDEAVPLSKQRVHYRRACTSIEYYFSLALARSLSGARALSLFHARSLCRARARVLSFSLALSLARSLSLSFARSLSPSPSPCGTRGALVKRFS